mgnify:CR=1 FL=1
MGAWIEILLKSKNKAWHYSRTLYGCVDWNIGKQLRQKQVNLSHPLWVRGLKSASLKCCFMAPKSHPLWVRGLKFRCCFLLHKLFHVAPFMGAWIEISPSISSPLKTVVAPFMGAWIEIWKRYFNQRKYQRRTLYGCVDWNIWFTGLNALFSWSHPLWVRGLKSSIVLIIFFIFVVAPFMGAWIEIKV